SGTSASDAYVKTSTGTTNLRDNILINTRTTSGSGKQYAIRYSGSGLTSNYNDIYNSGSTNNVLGNSSGADRTTLAAWQSATGQDANSQNILPSFVSATDLHLDQTNTSLDNKGTPAGGITADYDYETRSASTPDI